VATSESTGFDLDPAAVRRAVTPGPSSSSSTARAIRRARCSPRPPSDRSASSRWSAASGSSPTSATRR
jgi:hypothetical protein